MNPEGAHARQVWGQVVHMWCLFAEWRAKGVHVGDRDHVHPEGGGVFGPRSETRA